MTIFQSPWSAPREHMHCVPCGADGEQVAADRKRAIASVSSTLSVKADEFYKNKVRVEIMNIPLQQITVIFLRLDMDM